MSCNVKGVNGYQIVLRQVKGKKMLWLFDNGTGNTKYLAVTLDSNEQRHGTFDILSLDFRNEMYKQLNFSLLSL